MRAEKFVSFAALLLLAAWTLAADQFVTRGARGATGLLVIKAVSGAELVGSGDCTNINSTDSKNCPDAFKGANCTNQVLRCHAATTGQTNTATCTTSSFEICQDTAGKCAAGYNETSTTTTNCTLNTVPE